MIEITTGKTKDSKFKKRFSEQYKRLTKEIKDIEARGNIVEIPSEVF